MALLTQQNSIWRDALSTHAPISIFFVINPEAGFITAGEQLKSYGALVTAEFAR